MADCSFMAVYMLPRSDDSLCGNTNSDWHGRRVSSSPMLSAAFDVGKRLVRARLMISPPIQAHRPWPVHEGRLRGRRQTSFRGNRVCRRWSGGGGVNPTRNVINALRCTDACLKRADAGSVNTCCCTISGAQVSSHFQLSARQSLTCPVCSEQVYRQGKRPKCNALFLTILDHM